MYLLLHPGQVNLYTTELSYLAGVLSLFERNELLLVVFQLMMKLYFNFSSGVILCINEQLVGYHICQDRVKVARF
jgi:hypothetical protein